MGICAKGELKHQFLYFQMEADSQAGEVPASESEQSKALVKYTDPSLIGSQASELLNNLDMDPYDEDQVSFCAYNYKCYSL